ncbi:MAG: ATP synthase F1 subunit gamma [Spirochaetota bacterium]|nr:ATP synthase F1 subunit gamma [Spirochaetota bacterium]
MATQKEIRKRIQSVSTTKKITKTMEMVATAKMKKMQDRLNATKPYSLRTKELISHIKESGIMDSDIPLMKEREDPNRVLLIMITGNRGLCGGYNMNVIDNTLSLKDKLERDDGREVLLYAIGKKGKNYFDYMDIPIYQSVQNREDKLTFNDASEFGDELIDLFLKGEIDDVYVSYTGIVSSTSQKPAIIRLLPITYTMDVDSEDLLTKMPVQYIFDPEPYKVLSSLLPLYIKVSIYTYLLESGFSEQFARRVAMKNATDAAIDMVKELTVKYNRARQAKITNEIAEIVGGASALE